MAGNYKASRIKKTTETSDATILSSRMLKKPPTCEDHDA
jgi:hypothetical protein